MPAKFQSSARLSTPSCGKLACEGLNPWNCLDVSHRLTPRQGKEPPSLIKYFTVFRGYVPLRWGVMYATFFHRDPEVLVVWNPSLLLFLILLLEYYTSVYPSPKAQARSRYPKHPVVYFRRHLVLDKLLLLFGSSFLNPEQTSSWLVAPL